MCLLSFQEKKLEVTAKPQSHNLQRAKQVTETNMKLSKKLFKVQQGSGRGLDMGLTLDSESAVEEGADRCPTAGGSGRGEGRCGCCHG